MTDDVAHSPLGPSRWDRFVRCPGSVRAEARFSDRSGWEAAEGTAFHWVMAQCLTLGFDPEDFLGETLQVGEFEIEVNEDMCLSGRPGLDYINGLVDSDSDWELSVETRVDISYWTRPGEFGTADVILIHPGKRELIVWDWKYGRGEPVYAEESWQLKAYALGAWWTRAVEVFGTAKEPVKVTLHIEQPRYPGAGGSVEMTMMELLAHGQYAAVRAKLALGEDAPREPGEKQCRYCRAAPSCGEFAKWNLDMLGMDFDDLDAADPDVEMDRPDEVTPERRSTVLRARPLIEKWLDMLHASAYRDAELGNPVPGMKLVAGRRPLRKYAPDRMAEVEATLVGELDDAAWKPAQLITPAAAEKALGRAHYNEKLADFVEQGEPKPVLVGEEDSRPEIRPVSEDLENLDEQETTNG